MKVRKTLIYSLDNQDPDTLSRHSLLYRAANWLENTMRTFQAEKDSDTQLFTSDLSDFSLEQDIEDFPFRRYLIKARPFMIKRGRLPICTNLRRVGPYHW